MWFLNKTTGVKWEIDNKELIERLSKDDNFEIINETIVDIEPVNEVEPIEEIKEDVKEPIKKNTPIKRK